MVKVKVKNGDAEDILEFSINEIQLISGGYEGTVSMDNIKIEAEEEDAEIVKELFKDN